VPLGSAPADAEDSDDDQTDACEVRSVQTLESGVARDDDGAKHEGPKRLRMTVGVRRGAANPMMFRYYLEDFGEVSFPGL
jgi:hypothetical protein